MKQWWRHGKTSLYNHRSIVIVSYHCVIAITLHSGIAPPSLLPGNGITVFALSRHRHRFNFHRSSTQTSMVQWSIMNYETRYRYQTSKSHVVNENRSLHLSFTCNMTFIIMKNSFNFRLWINNTRIFWMFKSFIFTSFHVLFLCF